MEHGASTSKLDHFIGYLLTMVYGVYCQKIKRLSLSIETTEFKAIINVCLNLLISCHLFRTLICDQIFQHKAKLLVLNSWWTLNRVKSNRRTLIGTTKRWPFNRDFVYSIILTFQDFGEWPLNRWPLNSFLLYSPVYRVKEFFNLFLSGVYAVIS